MRIIGKFGLVLTVLFIGACGLFSSDGGGDNQEVENHYLSVSTEPSAAGTVEPSSGSYEEGSELSLSATANEDYTFDSWTGYRETTENPLAIVMNSDVEITANFSEASNTPDTYDLMVLSDPSEAGTVVPADSSYQQGSEVTIEAIPNEGWQFLNWTGDFSGSNNPANITIDDHKEITANYENIESRFTVNLTYKDEIGEMNLQFGQHHDPEIKIQEAPPPPPEGSFNAYFEHKGTKYIRDFRSSLKTDVQWKFKFTRGSGKNVELNWEVEANDMDGTLSLTNEKDTLNINMENQQGFSIPDSASNTYYFKYSN